MGKKFSRTTVYSKKGHTIKSIFAGRRHHINFFKFDKIICASKNYKPNKMDIFKFWFEPVEIIEYVNDAEKHQLTY
jgi:hypothetical protein